MSRKTILVTGGAGHVGSHVVEQLVADHDNRVISLDNYSTGRIENHIAGAEYRTGHTKDIARLVPERPDLVYHLGEYARVATSFDDVGIVFDYNVVGTFAVAEFCRDRAVGKIVYAASSTKYAVEGDERRHNPYSSSKATNIDLLNDYGRWFGLPYAICYFYNAFGPREMTQGKYATLIGIYEERTKAGLPLQVVKPGTQRRVFTHVSDLARGLILAGEHGNGDDYFLRGPSSHSVLEIAQAFGGPIEMVDGWPGRTDVTDDPTRAQDELHWRPTIDILDYIRDFRANL